MDFTIDASLTVGAGDLLHPAGYDAVPVVAQPAEGASDSSIASACQEEGCTLTPLDADSADISAYPAVRFPGSIALRCHGQDRPGVLEIIGRLTSPLSGKPPVHRLWVTEATHGTMRGWFVSGKSDALARYIV